MQTNEAVIFAVCAAYGLEADPGATLVPVARGAMGQIWRLSLKVGSFAVKEFFWGADEEAVRQETRYTRHLMAAGIRLPGSIPDQRGDYLIRLPDELGGAYIRLYQWISGVPIDGTEPHLAIGVGQLLGQLHANALPTHGEEGDWYTTAPSSASWGDLAEAGFKDQQPWAQGLSAHLGLLDSLSVAVSPAPKSSLVMCHRDFRASNVFKDGDGNLILLDWDDAGPASPDRELAQMLLDWHANDAKINEAAVHETVRAYVMANGTGRVTGEQSFGMAIASRVNFIYVQAKAALDPEFEAVHRKFSSDAVSKALGDLVTPDLIHRLVDVSLTAQQESS